MEETMKQAVQAIMEGKSSKSQKMKEMFDLGLDVKTITAVMSEGQDKPMRYNFVYNVISNHCNMNGLPMGTTKTESKKDAILEMHKAGKTNKEICIELKTNLNYVFNVVKAYKATNTPPEAQAE